jgi:hypothetical protein
MRIVAALFVDNFALRTDASGLARIDITGAHFSLRAPSPFPCTVAPHLAAILHCPPEERGNGVFEVVVRDGPSTDATQLARNASPFTVEPGKFTYRLVRSELTLAAPGQVFAHCRVDGGPWHLVPLSVVAP